jgi:hypothetical protein
MTQRANTRRYLLELAGALALYSLILGLSLRYGQRLSPGPLQTATFVCPMAGFLLVVWAVARQIRRSDEYLRKTTLEYLAIAAAVTAGWTFTYGFLENAGFPRLSMFTVWPVMGAVWGLVACADYLRQR